jgi:ABC-type bacteriocin/lantibiotic exporter with double-glycine peptidase domain
LYITQQVLNPIDLLYLAINTSNFCSKILQLKDIYNYYRKINPKLKIVYEMLNNKGENFENTKNIKNALTQSNTNIIFKDITFSYDGIVNVLNKINFVFQGHKINLLLGPNGSGKSTLIKLLLRIYELNDDENQDINKIYFNGIDVKNINLIELRQKIVFVSQEPNIFNESVLYNIKYGNEDIADVKIIELCDIIYSRDWLINNKNKLAGFRGRNLSGGEKKKIQLINAICKDTEVMIFDEPTNTLDSKALEWFMEFLKILRDKYNKTIVIITHDLRLVNVSDNVIDLNK